MKILRREEIWIHTHFVTDCVYLPEHRARHIRRELAPVLEESGIVFGIHFESGEEGLRIVLECLPLPPTMEKVESALTEIVTPLPARPRKTRVTIEPPARSVSLNRR